MDKGAALLTRNTSRGVIRSNRILSAILFRGDVCEWLKQLTRKVRGPAEIRAQRFESSHHRHLDLEALGIWRARPVRSGPSFGM